MERNFVTASTARLAQLIEDQERLLEIVRREKAQLVEVGRTVPSKPCGPPTQTD
jgi:hypothetical protein